MRLRSRYLAGFYLRYRRVWMKVAVGAFDWAIETLDHRHGFSPPKASRNEACDTRRSESKTNLGGESIMN
jgi:hypothetical protein